jgi:hypothetical protein
LQITGCCDPSKTSTDHNNINGATECHG